jgi:hypothetical protein
VTGVWRAIADVLGGLVIGFGVFFLVSALFGPGYVVAPLVLVLIGGLLILVAELLWICRRVASLERLTRDTEGGP